MTLDNLLRGITVALCKWLVDVYVLPLSYAVWATSSTSSISLHGIILSMI